MSDQQRDPLERLLDEYDARLRKQKESQDAAVAREDRFLSEFADFRVLTAHPLFEQVGNHLRSRGHEFEIALEEYEVGRNGKTTDASIAIYFYPSGIERYRYHRHDLPSLVAIASRRNQKVRLRASNMVPGKGGTAGDIGEFSLGELTPQLLERELMKVLTDALTK